MNRFTKGQMPCGQNRMASFGFTHSAIVLCISFRCLLHSPCGDKCRLFHSSDKFKRAVPFISTASMVSEPIILLVYLTAKQRTIRVQFLKRIYKLMFIQKIVTAHLPPVSQSKNSPDGSRHYMKSLLTSYSSSSLRRSPPRHGQASSQRQTCFPMHCRTFLKAFPTHWQQKPAQFSYHMRVVLDFHIHLSSPDKPFVSSLLFLLFSY